ncbi:hypothetical protein AB1Y20_016737 [Prymnesium parvum]|uniref:GS catalytic domain-containing protein n=2 Tax=Prymnesium parvum TaxID=97485 RepID=A0AB34IBY2_PRYPA
MGCTLSLPQTPDGIPIKVTSIPSSTPTPQQAGPSDDKLPPPVKPMESGASTVRPDEINFIESMEDYGTFKFKASIAAPFLIAQGLPANVLDDPSWTHKHAEQVAKAVVEWCKSKGATMATHWFQPLGSAGVRRGQTGQVHNAMFNFGANGKLDWVFDGGVLLKGETDGSSYMNGGMRATHTAGGYTALDPSSPMFIRNDTLYIPTVFVSFYGKALDEKTPLLRAMEAVSLAGTRLLKLLGHEAKWVKPMIGLEQEFFLVPREAYYKRPDLQLAGRTVMGAFPARGQELSDHYMAPLNPVALACMREMQHEAFKMGIPLNTRHREVAPNQYECAPYFGIATTQIDENLMVMELMEEIAAKHGLVCLLHEKPFKGINGSGKHNNFSLATDAGVNLFNGPQLTKKTGKAETFPVVMSAVVQAVHNYSDLMRMAIAAPGNDFRLGAMEAPPAIISTYLGEALTKFLEEVKDNAKTPGLYDPAKTTINLGVPSIAPFTVPAEDRNRTSPFPYGGHRFEFRAVGSSQNVSMVNTVLCAAIADAFNNFSDAIEKGEAPLVVAQKSLKETWKIIFNGNGYSAEWPVEAASRGLPNTVSGVEAAHSLSAEKNVKLFEKLGVMTPEETNAREEAMHDQYSGMVEIELKVMVEMINRKCIPACKAAGLPASTVGALEKGVKDLNAKLHAMEAASTPYEKARAARTARLETMEEVRKVCDAAEMLVPEEMWPIASYQSLLFLDFHQGNSIINATA